MKDYSTAKIYKIVGGDKIYYGATLQPLYKRFNAHKGHKKRYDSGESNKYCSSYEVLSEPDCNIYLVESLPTCSNRDELNARERYYVENNKCTNRNIPARTVKEWETKNYNIRKQQRHELEKNKQKTEWTCSLCNIQLTESKKRYHITKNKIHLTLATSFAN